MKGCFWLALLYYDSMAVIQDFYSETNYSGVAVFLGYSYGRCGQTFTPESTSILSSCEFYLKKTGSPTGNIVAKLYNHTGTWGSSGKPTGSALATSNSIDVSTIGTSYGLLSFTFPVEYITLLDTKYCISLEYSDGSAGNYISVGLDHSSPTHQGNLYTTNIGSSTYSTYSTYDAPFYVYGTDLLLLSLSDSISINESIYIDIPIRINIADYVYVEESSLNQPFYNNYVVSIYGGNESSGETTQAASQQFLATHNYIKSLTTRVYKFNSPTDDLLINITDSPGGSSLWQGSINGSSLGSGANIITWIPDTYIDVVQGTQYYIEMSRSGARDVTNRVSWYRTDISGYSEVYSGGVIYLKSNNLWVESSKSYGDFVFSVNYSDGPQILIEKLFISVSENISISENVSCSTSSLIVTLSSREFVYVQDSTLNLSNYEFATATIYGGSGVSGETAQAQCQEITATGTILSGITTTIFGYGFPTDNLVLNIRTSVGGESLFSASVDASGISGTQTINWGISPSVTFVNGTKYYIELSRDGARDTTNYIGWYKSSSSGLQNVYDGGVISYKNNNTWYNVAASFGDFGLSLIYDDNPSLLIEKLFISVYDSISVSENISIVTAILCLELYDLLSVSENISAVTTTLFINDHDTIVISEYIEILIPFLAVIIYDSVNVIEDVSVFESAPSIVLSDLLTVSEYTDIFIYNLSVSVYDTVIVAEYVNSYIQYLLVSQYDTIVISENLSTYIVDTSLFVDDSISVIDNVNMFVPNLCIDISNTILVDSNLFFNLITFLSTTEQILISEGVLCDIYIQNRLFPNVPRSSTPVGNLILSSGKAFLPYSSGSIISEGLSNSIALQTIIGEESGINNIKKTGSIKMIDMNRAGRGINNDNVGRTPSDH